MISTALHFTPLLLAACAALILSALPANANQLSDWKKLFHDHCSTHGLSLTCSDKDEHKKSVDNPDTYVPAGTGSTGPFPSFNSKGQIGFWDENDNIDLSGLLKANNPGYWVDGGKHDEFSCTTKTGTISLIPLKLTKSETTVAGHC